MVWLVALGAATWVALLVAAPLVPGWAGALLYGVGSVVCHQIPERSFHLSGFQLPVCARCLGLYAGAAIGGVAIAIADRRPTRIFAGSRRRRWVAGVAALPTLATVVLETVGAWAPSNLTRALAGVPLGGVAALVVGNALATLHYGECVPLRPNAPRPPPPSI
jgi:uncharacterized membrane protein